jgi:hypothetical protein
LRHAPHRHTEHHPHTAPDKDDTMHDDHDDRTAYDATTEHHIVDDLKHHPTARHQHHVDAAGGASDNVTFGATQDDIHAALADFARTGGPQNTVTVIDLAGRSTVHPARFLAEPFSIHGHGPYTP